MKRQASGIQDLFLVDHLFLCYLIGIWRLSLPNSSFIYLSNIKIMDYERAKEIRGKRSGKTCKREVMTDTFVPQFMMSASM